jgi:hypothetical protein
MLPRRWPPVPLDNRLRDLDRTPDARLDAPTAALLREELAREKAALDEARKLTVLPQGRHNLTFRPNPLDTHLLEQHETAKVVALLRYDALERAQKGDARAALQSCRAALNAARSLGDEPFLVSQLIRIGGVATVCETVERVLALGEATDVELAMLQHALSEENRHPTLLVCLRGRRALLDNVYTQLETGTVNANAVAAVAAQETGGQLDWKMRTWGVSQATLRREHARTLDLLNRMIEVAALPEHEQPRELQSLRDLLDDMPNDALLTKLFLPPTFEAGEPCRRKSAQVRALMTLVAVERYRLKHQKWPEKLDDLKPDFLAAVPRDPYDGKPLRYVKRADGVTVYSVGHDGVDDGGTIDRRKPLGPGTDQGYRLWDLEARRKPPARVP